MTDRLLLPSDVSEAVGERRSSANLGMLVNRLIPDLSAGGWRQEQIHAHLRDRVAEVWKGKSADIDPALRAHRARLGEAASGVAESHGGYCARFTVKTETNLVIGMGNASVFENGLTLHHTMGFPYLPGSSIKGITSNWLREACLWDETGVSPGEFQLRSGVALQEWEERLTPVFGSQDQRGLAQFWDAFPVRLPGLEVDIMNCHYGPYYEDPGKNPPADWYQPNPVFFLAITPGTEFEGHLLLIPRPGYASDNLKTCWDDAKRWLEGALTAWGVGGKTRKGYGQIASFELKDKATPA